jgi:23S rRNA (guanosine2251-2'-O)-methyltransferase
MRKKPDFQRTNLFKKKSSINNFPKNENKIWIIGKHPVFMALQKKRRQVFEILATKNTINDLENFLQKNSLENLRNLVRIIDNKSIQDIIGLNQLHQGLAIFASKLNIQDQFSLLEELNNLEPQDLPNLLLLDQISDPQNVGAIMRSASAFGFKKIIFSEHNSVIENTTIIKASAGNIEFLDLVVAGNFNNLLEKLKKIGYWSFGLDSHASTTFDKIKEFKNIALVVGSEGEGIRQLVKKNCDFLLKVETNSEVESLNVSVATAIALYEINRR